MSSLRWRLALAFALLAAAVAGAVGVVVYEVTAGDLLSRARATAVDQVQAAALIYPLTKPSLPRSALPAGDPSVPAGLRATVRRGLVGSYSGTWNGTPVVWAGRRTPDGRGELYVRDSYAPQRQELADLRRTLIESAAAAAATGALLGLLLAGRLSLRLRRAAATAERVTAGELDARIRAGGHDEVAKLGEAIDRMAEAMQLRIERERQFVADVAHDLRTPLTGLKTAASLLPADEVGEAVRGRVDRLHGLVEDLLEISRLDSGTATADLRRVDLGAFVTSVVGGSPDVVVTTNGASETLVDPRRLERVIANVLENALGHGAPPVEIAVSPGLIALRDHGRGFSGPLLARAAERFTTGDPARGGGIGLGLAIASGQCHVLGGELRLANHPDGGAVVTIVLPQA
ncbi:MAG TPA: HAMP domain-containing sensor histidine kinase [Gaiellales bacterium]|nr:HAMP domain-containing sensor histidine kinase [Gaiellales bacterium]